MFFSESASIMRLVMVVFPEPVPPQIPMISGLLSSGRIARASQVRTEQVNPAEGSLTSSCA